MIKLLIVPRLILAVLALTIPLQMVKASPLDPPRLGIPTMGGKQVWSDQYFHAGWRIQQNMVTGHYRLLDNRNHRWAFGSYNHCLKQFLDLQQRGQVAVQQDRLVILVHGILRSGGSFDALADKLRKSGFDTAAISYASTTRTIEEHATSLENLIHSLEGVTELSFVTHSMGGLVVRELLSRDSAWRKRIDVNHVVMIAPPNQGSQIADQMRDVALYRGIYGLSGQQLTTDYATTLPVPAASIGIIAGGRGDPTGFNPILSADNDSVVTVPETRLPGAREHIVLPALHSTLLSNPDVINATLRYLSTGSFTLQSHQP